MSWPFGGEGSTWLGVGGEGQPKPPRKYENTIRKVATLHVKKKEREKMTKKYMYRENNSQASFVFWHSCLQSPTPSTFRLLVLNVSCISIYFPRKISRSFPHVSVCPLSNFQYLTLQLCGVRHLVCRVMDISFLF